MSKRGTEMGDKHFTTSIYLISDESESRALMVFHKKLKVWIQPGGHVERKENPIDTVIRETMEETGIDLKPYVNKIRMSKYSDGTIDLPLPQVFHQQPIPTHGDEPAHYHLDLGYVFKIKPKEPTPAKGESQDVKWFTQAEINKLDTLDSIKSTFTEILNT
jgi:8-oxo-dGTP pyrophosphatase MutT (NUDIX family)